MIRSLGKHRPDIYLWADASGSYGMGGHIKYHPDVAPLPNLVFSHRFSSRLRPRHLNVKEMTAILIAIRKWLHLLRGKHLVIYGDNYAVSSGLKKRSISGAAMAALRDICMLLASHVVTVTSNWISTKENILADLLSRGKWSSIANSWSQLITDVSLPKSGTAKLV